LAECWSAWIGSAFGWAIRYLGLALGLGLGRFNKTLTSTALLAEPQRTTLLN